jgi:hypothetical protein
MRGRAGNGEFLAREYCERRPKPIGLRQLPRRNSVAQGDLGKGVAAPHGYAIWTMSRLSTGAEVFKKGLPIAMMHRRKGHAAT